MADAAHQTTTDDKPTTEREIQVPREATKKTKTQPMLIVIKAKFDPDSESWWATADIDDHHALATGAPTLNELLERFPVVLRNLLAEAYPDTEIPFSIIAHKFSVVNTRVATADELLGPEPRPEQADCENDIVQQLRDLYATHPIVMMAADEIGRLRHALNLPDPTPRANRARDGEEVAHGD